MRLGLRDYYVVESRHAYPEGIAKIHDWHDPEALDRRPSLRIAIHWSGASYFLEHDTRDRVFGRTLVVFDDFGAAERYFLTIDAERTALDTADPREGHRRFLWAVRSWSRARVMGRLLRQRYAARVIAYTPYGEIARQNARRRHAEETHEAIPDPRWD
jgi:hypothetical protein